MDNSRKNSEGYTDPTAYHGTKAIVREENVAEERLNRLIKTLKYIIGLTGFELVSRIELRDTKTGRTYR